MTVCTSSHDICPGCIDSIRAQAAIGHTSLVREGSVEVFGRGLPFFASVVARAPNLFLLLLAIQTLLTQVVGIALSGAGLEQIV